MQTIVYLLFVRAIDLYEREDFRYVIPVFVWGFSVAVAIALVFNTLIGATLGALVDQTSASFLTAVFVAPPVEEVAKGLALFIAFAVSWAVARRRGGVLAFSGVMDGIVYGSAVGFGFSIVEDVLYYAQTYQEAGNQVFVLRRVFGGFAHAAFTSLTGIGIGLIPWVRGTFLKVLMPVLGLSGAIFLHATFNLTATLFGPLAYVVEFLVLVVYAVVIIVWLAVERGVIREELREEVAAGTIGLREYEILPTYFARTFYYLGLIFSGRLGEWRRARKVNEAAVDLAFTKRLSRYAYAAPQEHRVQDLRERIRQLRGGPGRSPQPAS